MSAGAPALGRRPLHLPVLRARDGNIGAPAQPDEIDHFLVMLRATKQHATDADLAAIESELREFAKPYQRPPR